MMRLQTKKLQDNLKENKEEDKTLKEKNIELRHVWKPMHLQPLFLSSTYFKHSNDSFCDDLFNTSVCLPSSSNMNREQQKTVISEILKVLT